MNKKVYQIMSAIVALVLTLGSYTSAGAVTQRLAVLPAKTITTPQTYDCGGAQISGIDIKNTHDVLVKNCNVVGKISIMDASIVTIRNVSVTNAGTQSGAISVNASANNGLTHDIVIEDFHIFGNANVGWAISGSPFPMKNITVRRGLIEDIGQAGGVQTHGMYVSNWQGFLIEDITILRSWNTGLKIVGDAQDGIIRRVVIKDSGMAGSSGPGISLGDTRVSHMARLTFEYCDIQNSLQPAIWILDTVTAINDITIDHNYFKNNYRAIMITNGAKGWKVTNNVAYNQTSYAPSHAPVYVDNATILSNNFFDNNNWYFDGQSPFNIGSSALSLAQWQAKGVDLHSVSSNPGVATATPPVVPAVTLIATLIPKSPTPTATKVPASPTPITTTVSASPTPTSSVSGQGLNTPTASSIPASVTPAATTVPATATKVPASLTSTATSVPATASSVPVSSTQVLVTRSVSSLPASPTPTASPIPASATPTASPIPPTDTPTATPIPPTATPTASPIPPTETPTASPIPPTDTPTATPIPPTETPTASPIPPTETPTASPIPPTDTPTATPIPPTATPTDIPQQTNQLPSGTVFDDKDGSFIYSPGWKDVTRKDAYGGSYKETTKNDSFVTFTFSGQSFSVIYKSGQTYRKIDVYVDGLLVGTINEKGRSVFQKSWDYPGQLTLSSHTLKLVFVGRSHNTAGSVDAVIIR